MLTALLLIVLGCSDSPTEPRTLVLLGELATEALVGPDENWRNPRFISGGDYLDVFVTTSGPGPLIQSLAEIESAGPTSAHVRLLEERSGAVDRVLYLGDHFLRFRVDPTRDFELTLTSRVDTTEVTQTFVWSPEADQAAVHREAGSGLSAAPPGSPAAPAADRRAPR